MAYRKTTKAHELKWLWLTTKWRRDMHKKGYGLQQRDKHDLKCLLQGKN